MNSEFQPASFEVEPQGGPSDSFELSYVDKAVCARTNLIDATNGDELSRRLLKNCIRVGDDGTAEITCLVPVCPVKYELTLEDGNDTRQGDCAVVMMGILRSVEALRSGRSRGLSFEEFAQTPLGQKIIKK